MTHTAILKGNYTDLNFGYGSVSDNIEPLKISLHRFYNGNDTTLVAFKIKGNKTKLDHLTANDGAIYMSLNEVKWLSHHLNSPKFIQLKRFLNNISAHIQDVIAISEEFEEHYAMTPNCLQDNIYISSQDAEIVVMLLDRILTLN